MREQEEAVQTAGAIYIGSSALQMKIGEAREGMVKELDILEYPLNIGQDTFSRGKISFEKAEKIGGILKGFLNLAEDYQIKKISMIGTIALRDAENKQYILDQIKVKTGEMVRLLDDAEEKELIYKEMLKALEADNEFSRGKAFMTYIGTGSLGIALYDQGMVPFTQNIRIGPLKLNEILDQIQTHDERSSNVVEEYLSTFTDILKNKLPDKKTEYFIASGQEMDLIAKLCQAVPRGPFLIIERGRFDRLYEEIKNYSDEQLAESYGITVDDAEMLLPAMSIYKTLLGFTEAKVIINLAVNLLDALLYQRLFPVKSRMNDERFMKNTVLSARILGEKYKYNKNHALAVEKFALQIFDKTIPLHGLGNEERLLLQVAAVLHDVGKYIDTKGHALHSYYIIKNSDITGLNDQEGEIAGQIALYHGKSVPHHRDENYGRLLPEQKAVVSKLVAILRIADALDRGHSQKFSTLKINLKKDLLMISGKTQDDIHTEKWAFERKGSFFEEVFGIKAELHKQDI